MSSVSAASSVPGSAASSAPGHHPSGYRMKGRHSRSSKSRLTFHTKPHSASRFAARSHRHQGYRSHHAKNTHYLPVDQESIMNENNVVIDPDTLGRVYYSQIFNMPVDTAANIKMLHSVESWMGAPYRLGGSSHWGIDCSQFAKKIYSSVSSSFVGQTCREIIGRVQRLSKLDLKPGDFVFFKMHGRSVSHMGVYLGSGKFVHSSTSKGVMISDLSDPYFQKRFMAGGRANPSDDLNGSPGLITN